MTTAAADHAVAITGMACLFPGSPGVDAYWQNILTGTDVVTDPPPEAWDPDVYYDPEFANPDATYCKRGGYLGSLASFDPLPFGIPPVTVGGEPDQWLALRVAHEALADAGATELPDEVRARTAVVLGKGTYLNGGNAIAVQRGLVVGQTIELLRTLHPEHSEEELDELRAELQRALPPMSAETVPGLIPNIIVGRIANRFDLGGPSYTVDAACASSLVALQLAIRDLLNGDADLALAGGSQVWMPVATLNVFCRLGALSRTEQIRPFDRNADGTLLGEGIGMIVLKRLADARRDGDRVYAAIRAVGVSSDGRGTTVMAPLVDGEELALRRAYEAAGVSPASVGLIEAHGTATPVGDDAEIDALTRVFGRREGELAPCAIGTVKSMISHTIPAAGVAGVIKAALALHHRVLPPTLHCTEPNPKLEADRTPFYVNAETRPWIHGRREPRRAGVNAFGFGGINAHAVLEEVDAGSRADHRPPWDTEVCILESTSAAGLADEADALAAALARPAAFTLTDLAFTLTRALGSVAEPQRLAIVASSLDDLRSKLGQAAEKLRAADCRRIKTRSGIHYAAEPLGREGGVALVFPGEGAQYAGMLADLCLHFDGARAVFDRLDRLYTDHARGYLLSDWVFPRPAFTDDDRRRVDEHLMQLDIAVESVLTANAAAYAVVTSLVRRVDALIGHSSGEHSAAMAAGVLDLDTDDRLAEFCHGLHDAYTDADRRHALPRAVLLALGTGAQRAADITARAGGELHLAMDNCPHQVVLVGEAEAIGRAHELATRDGIVAEELPYDRAVHTPLFAPFADDLRTVFAKLPLGTPRTAVYSCTTADRYPDDPEQLRRLLAAHWTSPVRFRETIERLYDEGVRVFLEVGPRGNMTAFVEDTLRGRPFCAVATDVRRRSGLTQLNTLVALLAVHDVDLDLEPLFAERRAEEVDWRSPGEAERPARRPLPLSMSWPMLRLEPDVVERLRRKQSATGNGRHIGGGNGAVAAPSVVAPPPPAAQPEPWVAEAPAVTATLEADEMTAALAGHLATMDRFLQASDEVMQAYLSGAAPVIVQASRLPLLGEVVAWEPGAELVARRVVDPAEDRYLLDHTLGSDVASTDPDLAALPLMPLAMSMEILAEGAACLVPESEVVGLRDVRAHRWLAWGEGPRTLEVAARRLTPDGTAEAVRVELRDLDADGAAPGPVVEGTVLLGDGPVAHASPLAADLTGARPSRYAPERLYEDVMFHQEQWRGVRDVELVAPAAARARLEVLPTAGMLRSRPDPEFVLDPVVLDAAGQVIGFWAADQLDRARIVFPFRLAALDLFGPRRPAGDTLRCIAAIALEGDALVRSDIEVTGGDGRPWMRLTGWEDRRFDVPERLAPLARPGALAPLSQPWDEPAAAVDGAGVVCRRMDSRLPGDAGLWQQVWARRVLGRRERAAFDALRLPPRRRLEFLGARTAAKEAVADLLRARHGIDLRPADIELVADERGAPRVEAAGVDALPVEPVVSLTHTGGHAAALAALVPRGSGAAVGIDVEQAGPRPGGFADAALAPSERHLLGAVSPELADEWLLRCWCAKEAAGKAVGAGVAASPRIVAAKPPGRTTIDAGGHRLEVRTLRDGELVVAVTTLATTGPGEAR